MSALGTTGARVVPAPAGMAVASAMRAMTAGVRTTAPRTRTRGRRRRALYRAVLTWAFTLFNSVRLVSYLPIVWAIWSAGDSSQHSLVTWFSWLGANLSMALWLYENEGRRLNKAIAVNAGNAAMCALTIVVIVAQRL